ncbi:carboxypeptidase regulatory-like domain-containing protein [Streptomyces sp. NBC_00102]|uniref:carboxypeptidase regulatory-like domain-containing protein n=1 Tax=Streptomyces sp. NBC_00102 TaxID=2975652 RepID=UPI0022577ACF|nr:carboxypeptidase regulatory-like domain-containing protein [Streptomyces sp. NBC_00102]MCX5400768.1 carboxypeptidase regulatory-like domain-containing protein [Streptomyces sp. NBC_00102]
MRIPRPFRPGALRIPVRLAVVVSSAMAVVGAGLPLAAAAGAEPAATSTPRSKPSVAQMCDAPQPGRVGCFAMRRTDLGVGRGDVAATATPGGYGPADLWSAYNLPGDGGEGRTVAIVVAYDDPAAESDLAVYRAQYGLPECTTAHGCFRKIDQRGGSDYPPPDSGWAGEASLDMDMVSAAAPGAHILLVEADSDRVEDIFAAVDQAVAQGAQYVSNSYGSAYDPTPGSGEDPAETTDFDAHYNHPGVAMVAASGDLGYGVAYPAASQYVTAVGGTALKRDTGAARGWSESVWHNGYGGTGSGCSAYEPKPAFQSDTGCDTRSVTDVSAVADPLTGVAVYQTYGSDGWGVMGGTSASSPIIAGVYAAADAPAADDYPNAYPYLTPSGLNDVTSGANGNCATSYLCTAGTGYDGPTGLGTPDGLTSFRSYPHGTVSGTVTDTSGAPLPRAVITAGDLRAVTDADGHYSLALPSGSYDLTAAAYGYAGRTTAAVVVTDGGSVTENFALAPVPRQTVTGKVTDSGHGWPLYATVTVDGMPGAPVSTDPYTGTYQLRIPEDRAYTLKVAARYPGYRTVTEDVTVTTSPRTVNFAVPVDVEAATAAGYELRFTGPTEPFDSTTAARMHWNVVEAAGSVGGWEFADPGNRGNHTGGDGAFAVVDSDAAGWGNHQDSSMLSPVHDFSGYTRPQISFDTDYRGYSGQTAAVDVTTDGGDTWTTLWTRTVNWTGHVEIPLTDYAGASSVRVRFHFTGSWGYWWALDNVFVGDRAYAPVAGGLLAGTVTDANTGDGVVGATVTDAPARSATTVATPDDPDLGDGFYWLFSDTVGNHSLTAAKSRYASATRTVRSAPDRTTEAGLALDAGRLTITPAAVDESLDWGGTGTRKLTVKNTGGAPATLSLHEYPGTSRTGAAPSAQGAPLQVVPGDYAPLREQLDKSGTGSTRSAVAPAVGGDAWKPVADLPTAVSDNAVAVDGGKLYSAYGYTGSDYTSDLYAYDADSGAWSQRASAAEARSKAAMGSIDGKLYAVGGWRTDGSVDARLEIYDPSSDSWTTGASSPKPSAASGNAVLDGELYVIGGCSETGCGTTDVDAYDPSTDSWSERAPYPEPVSWSACGSIAGLLYCAGGTADTPTKHAYAYDPSSNSWSPIADLPTTLWGSAHTAANGQLLTVGGRVPDGITNQSFAYDPQANTWSVLPNVSAAVYRGGGAPGFYSVGGVRTSLLGAQPVATAEVLPGYDQVVEDVTWLDVDRSRVTLAPGASAVVAVSLDSTVDEITRPGVYTANLGVGSDTPYRVSAIPVTMHVDPPKNWGAYTGTILGSDGTGGTVPLAGATVRIDGRASSHTLTAAADGTFALWTDARGAPLTVTVSRDGYQSAVAEVKLQKGRTTTGNFTLRKAP